MNELSGELILKHFNIEEIDINAAAISGLNYNTAPGEKVLSVIAKEEKRVLTRFSWGLVPSWAKSKTIGKKLINARAETVLDKPSFREAMYKRRCLIIANGYYEWKQHGKENIPYFIFCPDQPCIAFGGLYEKWISPEGDEIKTCIIITTAARKDLANIHHRMPVILDPKDYSTWINESSEMEDVHPLLKSYEGDMAFHQVSSHVNNIKEKSNRCIAKV